MKLQDIWLAFGMRLRSNRTGQGKSGHYTRKGPGRYHMNSPKKKDIQTRKGK